MTSEIGIVGQYLETEKGILCLAPEILEDLHNRTKEGNIYSFGIMLREMWYGDLAFKELKPLNKVTF